MRKMIILFCLGSILSCDRSSNSIPSAYRVVDQVIWIVSDLEKTISAYEALGFMGIGEPVEAFIESVKSGTQESVKLARANLGGAMVNWIEPEDEPSEYREFLNSRGDGAMALVHRFPGKREMNREIRRLGAIGIEVLDEICLTTPGEDIHFVLMDTGTDGKYVLGFTYGSEGMETASQLLPDNRHHMELNQYAFAIRDPQPVSDFWEKIGLPAFQINHPELGETRYYGELVDHQLIQGWQRHGTVAYEWCIPVKPPIVYEDHIRLHGEGIHHLAFEVSDMDEVLDDFTARGFVVSMGGTWGEKGKPGSGRYEYIDLEKAGGVTMELLWSCNE